MFSANQALSSRPLAYVQAYNLLGLSTKVDKNGMPLAQPCVIDMVFLFFGNPIEVVEVSGEE